MNNLPNEILKELMEYVNVRDFYRNKNYDFQVFIHQEPYYDENDNVKNIVENDEDYVYAKELYSNGNFHIKYEIEHGNSFFERIEEIDFEHMNNFFTGNIEKFLDKIIVAYEDIYDNKRKNNYFDYEFNIFNTTIEINNKNIVFKIEYDDNHSSGNRKYLGGYTMEIPYTQDFAIKILEKIRYLSIILHKIFEVYKKSYEDDDDE